MTFEKTLNRENQNEKLNSEEESESLFHINLLFKLDQESEKKVGEYYEKLKTRFSYIVKDRKSDGLPFHFTIIGGGKIKESVLNDFKNKKEGAIQESLKALKMFTMPAHVPKVKSFQVSWHTYPNHNEMVLIIRLKLENYILSGDKEINKQLSANLGNPNMDFTLPSHISVCKFLIEENSQISFDDFLKEAIKIFETMNLEKIELIPAVFVKKEGEKTYQEI